jgi:hypothetical protein
MNKPRVRAVYAGMNGRWHCYVDGVMLTNKRGFGRTWKSKAAAEKAGRKVRNIKEIA